MTATRTRQPLKDVPAHVTVLTQEDIHQSAAQTIDDLLRQIPGFSLFRRSSSLVAHPTTQGVSLRGIGPSGASRTLVLLDGIPMNDPFGGWVYWSKVPVQSIERIEVVRGGGSSVWGNYALGGVIHIITQPPQKRMHTLVGAGGTRGTVNLGLFASDVLGPVGVAVEGKYFHTDGYQIIRGDQRGTIDINNADSEQKIFNGKIEYALADDVMLLLHGGYFTEDRGNGTPLTHNATDAGYIRGGTRLTTPDGSEWTLDVFSHLQTFESTFSSPAPDRNSETPALDQFDVPSTAVGTSLQWSKQTHPNHLMTAGTDLRWIDGETNEDFVTADTDSFVPRLGVSYDLQGDGGTILQATYAHYAGKLHQNQFVRNTNVTNPSRVTRGYVGPPGQGVDFAPGYDPANYVVLTAAFPAANVIMQDGLAPPGGRVAGEIRPEGGLRRRP